MVSDEYTVVLLFDKSAASANLITQAFSGTGCPHLLRHMQTIESFKDYLMKSLEDDSSEEFIKPRLILISAEDFDDELRDLLRYIKTDESLKLIPVIVFCEVDCERSVGTENVIYINSFVKKLEDTEDNKRNINDLATYWLKWNNLPL